MMQGIYIMIQGIYIMMQEIYIMMQEIYTLFKKKCYGKNRSAYFYPQVHDRLAQQSGREF